MMSIIKADRRAINQRASQQAAPVVAKLFQVFDDEAARAFVEGVKTNRTLKHRVSSAGQLNRLRSLGNILLERPNLPADIAEFLGVLVDEQKPGEFFKRIGG